MTMYSGDRQSPPPSVAWRRMSRRGPRPHSGHRKRRRRGSGRPQVQQPRVVIVCDAACICGRVWRATYEKDAPVPRSPCHPQVYLMPLASESDVDRML